MTTEEIAQALDARWTGNRWMCRCVAHDDRTPSMSIVQGDKAPLVRCYAGCSQDEIIAELRRRGLWPESRQAKPVGPSHRKLVYARALVLVVESDLAAGETVPDDDYSRYERALTTLRDWGEPEPVTADIRNAGAIVRYYESTDRPVMTVGGYVEYLRALTTINPALTDRG